LKLNENSLKQVKHTQKLQNGFPKSNEGHAVDNITARNHESTCVDSLVGTSIAQAQASPTVPEVDPQALDNAETHLMFAPDNVAHENPIARNLVIHNATVVVQTTRIVGVLHPVKPASHVIKLAISQKCVFPGKPGIFQDIASS